MNQISLNHLLEKNHSVAFRIINNIPVILNYNTGELLELNEFGLQIWDRLPFRLIEILPELILIYDNHNAEEVKTDILEFTEFLMQHGYIIENGFSTIHYLEQNFRHLDKIESFGVQECIPTIAKFEITYECNLNCRHCYNITERNKSGILSYAEIKKIIDELQSIGTFLISFTGGEIFCRNEKRKGKS